MENSEQNNFNNEQNNMKDNIEVLDTNSQAVEEVNQESENAIEIIGESSKSVTPNGDINIDSNLNINNGNANIKNILIIIGLVIAVIIAGLFIFRTIFLFNKKNIIKGQVDTFFKMATSGIDSLEKNTLPIDLESDTVGIEGKLNLSSDYKGNVSLYTIDLNNLEKYDISYSGVLDAKNNKLSFDAALNKNNNKLLSIAAYLVDKVAYIKSDELSYNTYKVDVDEKLDITTNNKFNYNDLRLVLNKTKDIINNNIDEKNIEKVATKTMVNGKETSVVKFSYKYNLKELSKIIVDEYKNDQEIIDALSRLTGKSVEDVKTSLDSNEVKYDEEKYLTVISYSDSIFGTVKKVEIVGEEDSTITFEKSSDKVWNYVISGKEDAKITGEINNETKTITANYEKDDDKFNLVIKNEDNKIDMEANIEYQEYKVSLKINGENKLTDTTQESNITLEVKATIDGKDYNFKAQSELKLDKNAKVKEIDSSNAKDINELSEYELELIEYKLESIYSTIMSDFMKLNYSYYSSYGSTYNNAYSTSSSNILSM